ncbi:hypothetical protein EMPS_07694 [Entomortierella parvispora]|uniref:C-type lectin domain-containing protein n=1 Tax=Entomortierella parvispora TaxID=205924 RepID=A0A9P3HEL3_9FUNG|nr:hypothetical protein EMPS_07694 [Entomortierella parvispora]
MKAFSLALTLGLTAALTTTVQGGQILSSLFDSHPRRDPQNQVPGLDWNSQVGNHAAGSSNQNQNQLQFQQQQQGPPCRSRDRVYLPDMQSFVIQTPLTYQEAAQACAACGSELVLIDGTLVDRFREAFSSLGLYGDQRLWIKSWYGEQVPTMGACPAVYVNTLMGNRLEPIQEDCQTRLFALCY